MATTSPQKSPSIINTKNNVDPVKVPEVAHTAVTPTVEPEIANVQAPVEAAAQDLREEKVILSLSVTPRFAKQCRMLAKLTGKSMSTLVLGIVEAEVRAQLKVQLAELRSEVE
jgi:hypothetical protein